MFVVGIADADAEPDYALKPMSCPAHIAIYKFHKRTGTLSGCMRLRQFVQAELLNLR
ncbi:MAG: hypothetical protein N2235_22595 [Fischerella sp.]|nr:hypothetical protein [Fischerella sp.]